MKDFFIVDAATFEGQTVTTFFLLSGIAARDGKNGKQYLALTFTDKTGQIDARKWEEFAKILETCKDGCYVKVEGKLDKYQNKFQFIVSQMRPAADHEIETADFVPTSQYDIPTMAAELRSYVEAFTNPHLRALVFAFLDDPAIGPAFTVAPAAKRLHHAWIGGLLEHVLTLVRVCLATAPFYPEVDPELLVTGAILHDIGKIRELSWKSTFNYTLEGQLIGHISIATGMLHEKVAVLNAAAAQARSSVAIPNGTMPLNFHHDQTASSLITTTELPLSAQDPAAQDPAAQVFPDRLRLLIEHMLLSHHGKLEFGSPKLPMTPEAMLLSALDDLEAKFQALRNEFAAAKASGKRPDETTEWVRSMDRALFNSKAYLQVEKT